MTTPLKPRAFYSVHKILGPEGRLVFIYSDDEKTDTGLQEHVLIVNSIANGSHRLKIDMPHYNWVRALLYARHCIDQQWDTIVFVDMKKRNPIVASNIREAYEFYGVPIIVKSP